MSDRAGLDPHVAVAARARQCAILTEPSHHQHAHRGGARFLLSETDARVKSPTSDPDRCATNEQILGHAKLETTQIYTQISIRKLQEIHRATYPTARHERTPSKATAVSDEATAHELLATLEAEASDEEEP